jgi:hypothetical protein
MRSCSLVSSRSFGLVLLAVVAAGPAVLIACQQPGNAAPDAAPVATVTPPAVTSAAVTTTVSAVPLAPLAPLGGVTPANPGTPGHPHPAHGDGGAPAPGTAAPNAGGSPFVLPSGLPPLPSNLTIPTAFPSNLTLPSGLPQIVPPSSSTH